MLLGEMLENQAEQKDMTIDSRKGETRPKQTTKEDLLNIIKEKEADIKSLHAEIDKLEKYAALLEGADATKALHTAFMNSGFSDEQAFILTHSMINNIFKAGIINM